MAGDNKPNTQSPPTVSAREKLWDIKNPTPARRVIYDGIEGSQAAHTINPGAIKRGVKLSDSIARELQLRNKRRPNSDLIVVPQGELPEDKAPNASDED